MTSRLGVNRIELVFRAPAGRAIRALPGHRKAGRARSGDRNAAIPERSRGRPGPRYRDASDRGQGNRGPLAWRDSRRPSPARACRDGRTSSRSPVEPPQRRSASSRDGPRRRNGAGAVVARCLGVPGSHETDGQKLVQLGQRAQQRNARIEVRAGTVLDKIMPVFHRVRQRHKARNPRDRW